MRRQKKCLNPTHVFWAVYMQFHLRIDNPNLPDVHGLDLSVGCSVDIGILDKFFDGGKYGRDWVSRMVCHILNDAFAIK